MLPKRVCTEEKKKVAVGMYFHNHNLIPQRGEGRVRVCVGEGRWGRGAVGGVRRQVTAGDAMSASAEK